MTSIVHLLTNRSGPFQSAALPMHLNAWQPVTCSAQTEQLRAALQLARTDTDHYVLWSLRLLQALPDIRTLLGSLQDCVLHAAPVEIPTCSNGRLAAFGGQPASVSIEASAWPPAEKITVTLLSDVQVQIECGNLNTPATCRRAGPNVYVDWPVSIKGRVEWTDDTLPFVLYFRPRIPCSVLRAFIAQNDHAQLLLQRSGLRTSFEETMDDARAVALGFVALGRATQNGW